MHISDFVNLFNKFRSSRFYRLVISKAISLIYRIPITYNDGVFVIDGLKVSIVEDKFKTLKVVDYPNAYPNNRQEVAIHRILDLIP